MKRRGTIILGILLSGIFLYFAVRGAHVNAMLAALATADYWYMIPCVVLTLFAFWLRALRWRYLLYSIRVIPQSVVFSATMIGFLANNVLPARLGELVRAHVVGRRADISRSAALASILIERIFDLFTLLALFGLVAMTTEFPGGLDKVALLVLGLGVLTLLLLLVWHRYPERFMKTVLRMIPARFRGSAENLGTRFQTGLNVFDRTSHLLVVGFLSLLMWFVILVIVGLSMLALGIDKPQPQATMVALVAIALVTMIPSAPGFIGTMQGGGTLALSIYPGITKEQALAFTIVFHATQWFPVNIVGLIYLVREGLSLGQLSRLAGPEETPPPTG
jgi:uncharacterized protein (TIRG00374 family)